MKTSIETTNSLHLSYLPAYAQYLLDHKLEAFVELQFEIGRQLRIPLLQVYNHLTKEEFKNIALSAGAEFLQCLASNKAEDYISISNERWINNTLPNIDKHQVVAEDLSLIQFTRKKALLHFLPTFCSDANRMISIIEESDYFLTRLNAATTETYINLLQEKIDEHIYFIEKINSTSPSAIYVLDINENKTIYTNGKFKEILGYDFKEKRSETFDFVNDFIHPDDRAMILDYYDSLKMIVDKEIKSCKYRISNIDGTFRWMRNYDTVFKRKEDNSVWQIIGVVIDVTREKNISDELRKREKQLTEAQSLAHIGSWSYDVTTKQFFWSDEMYRIYELDESTKLSLQFISNLTHPEDREYGLQQFQKTLNEKVSNEFQYRIITSNGAEKFVHATVEIIVDKNNNPLEILGTAQDVTQQQHLIDRLQHSEELYKQAQSLAHIGNWTLELANNNITWSDEMYNIFELEKQTKITLEEWFTTVHPNDLEEMKDYWHARLRDHRPYDKTHRVVLKNGKVKTLHRKGKFEFEREGKPVRLVGTTQDVTEQYKVQHELKEKQTFIQKITDATPSIITSYNVINDRYVFVNEGLQKLLGYQSNEVLGKGAVFFTELIHPDDVTTLIQQSYAALQNANNNPEENRVTEFTYRMRHKDGHYKWFTTYATVFDRNQNGQVEHVLRISLDVTEQIDARKKIEEQELFIKQVADASPTILYLYDIVDNKFTYINQEIFYVLGYTPEEVIAMNHDVTSLLYHPDDFHLLPERKESVKKFQHPNSMIQYECRLKNKGGDWCWLVVREVLFQQSDEGNPRQILGAALDITKRKEMERSLLQNSYQLQQSNASLEEFAYVASHDLKEPLRKISTFGDRIIQTQNERLNDDGKIYLKKIIEASQRMQIMINDLLSISMISGDRSFQAFSLQTILEEVKQTLEYKIEKQNAIIEAKALPIANIVSSQFRQLFQNLLSNSLKFTRDGVQPVIKIEWAYISADKIKNVQVTKASQYLQLNFIDNGIGFEEEYAGKIFQIFQRLHGRSEYEGTGIGLAICKKIIEHHGGAIYAHGDQEKGSTFTILLPA